MEIKSKNGMAITSMVLGIVSISISFTLFFNIICGIAAIVFAIFGFNQIKSNPDQQSSKVFAKVGLITGIIGVVIGIIGLFILLFFWQGLEDFPDLIE